MMPNKNLASIALALAIVGCSDFPSDDAVNAELAAISQTADGKARADRLASLLGKMADPQSKANDQAVVRVIDSISGAYLKEGDPWVFSALVNVKLDGGFANYICGFYTTVKDAPTLKGHVADGTDGGRWLSKCVGISISKDEYTALVRPSGEGQP